MIFNNSRFKDYEFCPRFYFWKWVKGIVEKETPEVLEEGTVVHAALAAWYEKRDLKEALWCINDHFDKKIAAAEFDIQRDHFEDRRDHLCRLVRRYTEVYAHETFVVHKTELPFITPLGTKCLNCSKSWSVEMLKGQALPKCCGDCGKEITWIVGRADLVYIENGLMKLMDHKTKEKSVNDNYLSNFVQAFQFTQYMYGLSQSTQRKIAMGMANILVKLKTVGTDKAKGQPFHRVEEISKDEYDFEEFIRNRSRVVEEIETDIAKFEKDGHKSNAWRKDTSGCYLFKQCAYYDICHLHTEGDWSKVTDDDLGEKLTRRDPDYVDDYKALIDEEIV